MSAPNKLNLQKAGAALHGLKNEAASLARSFSAEFSDRDDGGQSEMIEALAERTIEWASHATATALRVGAPDSKRVKRCMAAARRLECIANTLLTVDVQHQEENVIKINAELQTQYGERNCWYELVNRETFVLGNGNGCDAASRALSVVINTLFSDRHRADLCFSLRPGELKGTQDLWVGFGNCGDSANTGIMVFADGD